MPVIVIVGCQWGDEGKGKIVDLISAEADLVARYQGGGNAGHTVVINGKQIILHTVPTGILHKSCTCLIGNGVVIDPGALVEEIRALESLGLSVRERLMISENAHLVMPYHKLLDKMQEQRRGKGKIGTTGRGIGCAYGDKVTRQGVRVLDLRNKDKFVAKVAANLDFYKPLFEKVYLTGHVSTDEIMEQIWESGQEIVPLSVDGVSAINDYVDRGKKVLCEGAQGIHLDIDFGTYPYVTSSNPSSGGACTGLGISPTKITKIIGVAKAYTTRVGEGPLPTELRAEEGENLRRLGAEYGATTGRPRRCGWFDAAVVRRSIQLAGVSEIAVTKLDVLDTFEKISLCTHYEHRQKKVQLFPFGIDVADDYKPVYEDLHGWQKPIPDIRDYDALPQSARKYLERISKLLKVEIRTISVGAERGSVIRHEKTFFAD